MALTDDELRVRIRAQTDLVIEKLLAEKSRPSEITLSEIEQVVHEAGEAIKAELTAGLVEQVSEESAEVPGPVCPTCGEEMHYKGKKAKRLVTETGEVTVKRAYYYCEACRSGFFPPG